MLIVDGLPGEAAEQELGWLSTGYTAVVTLRVRPSLRGHAASIVFRHFAVANTCAPVRAHVDWPQQRNGGTTRFAPSRASKTDQLPAQDLDRSRLLHGEPLPHQQARECVTASSHSPLRLTSPRSAASTKSSRTSSKPTTRPLTSGSIACRAISRTSPPSSSNRLRRGRWRSGPCPIRVLIATAVGSVVVSSVAADLTRRGRSPALVGQRHGQRRGVRAAASSLGRAISVAERAQMGTDRRSRDPRVCLNRRGRRLCHRLRVLDRSCPCGRLDPLASMSLWGSSLFGSSAWSDGEHEGDRGATHAKPSRMSISFSLCMESR